ncbi:MAG: type I DNA topoisomerase [Spirochaetales bacterium]|nr:type I DNA topoisomerase [Spirochaetales bacterium]
MKDNGDILLIVESPAKARTIEKYLGKGYQVEASMGHLIDLPKSRLAVDVEHDYTPEYITVRGKAKILKNLIQKAKRTEKILLASDNDREGEAISYHIKNAILKKYPEVKFERIVFNEITPSAIREAIGSSREIDHDKVAAQKARRILDRLVGYHLSPILWAKVKNGLSAGRVQSVALRLLCEREQEVEEFIPEEYWTLQANLEKSNKKFTAQLVEYKKQKPVLKSQREVEAIVKELKNLDFVVKDIRKVEKIIKPKAPYTTSKLQQAAASRLGYISRKTMRIAQQLYEGINIGSDRVGLITYMRTDSTRVASSALGQVRDFIKQYYASELPPKPNYYSMAKRAQDAHEAIRPTYVDKTPESIKDSLSKEQHKLYSIIWEQFVSSQMNPAKSSTTSVDVEVGACLFRTSSTKMIEKGFQKVLKQLASKEKKNVLPKLLVGEQVTCTGFNPEQHFTSGPSRYTDASIIKTLEEKGIGRPSTYAPIISVLQDRYYIVRKNKQLVPTTLGRIINDILIKSFPDILNVNFTAEMENKLDKIEEHNQEWIAMLKEFYPPFKHQVDHVMDTLESIKGVLDEETDFVCEKCGKKMIKKLGRFGFFLACGGFPECRNTKSVPLADCPQDNCNGKIITRRRQGGRGREFYGCTNYPECEFISHFKPLNQSCPKCGKFLVEKTDKKRGSYKSCINPECDYLHTIDEYANENNRSEIVNEESRNSA